MNEKENKEEKEEKKLSCDIERIDREDRIYSALTVIIPIIVGGMIVLVAVLTHLRGC